MEGLLKPQQVADQLGVSIHTLKRWRLAGRGPEAVRLSDRTIRYTPDAVRAWFEGEDRKDRNR